MDTPRLPAPDSLPLLRRTLLGIALDEFTSAAFVFDGDGVVVAVNEAAATLTGYSAEELLAIDSSALVPDPSHAAGRVADVVAHRLRSGSSSIRCKNGSVVEVGFHVAGTMLVAEGLYYLSLCWPLAS